MKKIFFISLTIVGSIWSAAAGQPVVGLNERQQVMLLFPSEIRYADFGSGDVEGRIAATSRAIALKSADAGLPESTVSVVTADGRYYEFGVRYDANPAFVAYKVDSGAVSADTLALSPDKTTHFIASSRIVDLVVGSDSVAAGHAAAIENIVKAKQYLPMRAPGSLCVLTEKEVFPYVILPEGDFPTSILMGEEAGEAIFREASVNDGKLTAKAREVMRQTPFVTGVGALSHRMEFSLLSVMTDADWVMLRLQVSNRSDLDYAVDFVKIYIQDRKSARNTATQEDEIVPSYVYYPTGQDSRWIPGRGVLEFVQFFPRFSLPEKRMLTIELFEKNGGRHLTFHVLPKELLQARKL